MSKIKDAKGRTDGGSGYTRTLKNESLGQLISKVQATVISNGTELERMLLTRTKNKINNLDEFIKQATIGKITDGVYLCSKKVFSKSQYIILDNEKKKIQPDLLIFIVEEKRVCKVVELKDGDNFDTKKSNGEKSHLEEFALKFGAQIPFVAEYYICCFNQENKELIHAGFKGAFDLNHILTGKELCKILNVDYEEIVSSRKIDALENFDYFIDELLKIDEVQKKIIEKLNEMNESK